MGRRFLREDVNHWGLGDGRAAEGREPMLRRMVCGAWCVRCAFERNDEEVGGTVGDLGASLEQKMMQDR